MEPVEALEPVSRIASAVEAIEPPGSLTPIDRLDSIDRLDQVDSIGATEQPYATWATMPTTYDPYPAVLDPASAWLAAAATTQNLKVFSMGLPPRDRKRRS